MSQGRPASNLGVQHPDRFQEARILVQNEFHGLDVHQQYMNSFSRLLKWDPLERVTMLGTDQRDQFVPAVKEAVSKAMPHGGALLDIGCGDGKTFSLIADAIPDGSLIDAFDPNPEYVSLYEKALKGNPRLNAGLCDTAAFSACTFGEARPGKVGFRSSYDAILALHVLYFFDDLRKCVIEVYKRLSPNGVAILVFADEQVAYTGLSYRSYLKSIGKPEAANLHIEECERRADLFSIRQDTDTSATGLLSRMFPNAPPCIQIQRQETRLFGHSIADIIALSNISELEQYISVAKFESGADIIEFRPELVDFRVERDKLDARYGMLSVLQPQIVVTIIKTTV